MVNKTPKTWVVVCEDLHIATGLYTDLPTAIKVCKEANVRARTTGCVFKPVEIYLGDNVEYLTVEVPDTPEGLTGGYL